MSKNGVPYVGILATGVIALAGVGLNALVPDQAFEIVLNVSALGTIFSWTAIVLCQLQLWKWARDGKVTRPKFRLPGTPYTSYATLLFLAGVVLLMLFSDEIEQRAAVIAMLVVGVPALVGGWFLARKRVGELTAARAVVPAAPAPAEEPGSTVRILDEPEDQR
jgi:L-asparagine permease